MIKELRNSTTISSKPNTNSTNNWQAEKKKTMFNIKKVQKKNYQNICTPKSDVCRPVLHTFAQKTDVHIGFCWDLFQLSYLKSDDCANLTRHLEFIDRILQISPDISNLLTGFVQNNATKVGFRCSNRVLGSFLFFQLSKHKTLNSSWTHVFC